MVFAAVGVLLAGCVPEPLPAEPVETDPIVFPVEQAPMAEPGMRIKVGEVVTIPISSVEGDSVVEMTVVSSTRGSVDIWDEFDNADEFTTETPYLVTMQYRWPESSSRDLPRIYPYIVRSEPGERADDVLDASSSDRGQRDRDRDVETLGDYCPLRGLAVDDPNITMKCIVAIVPTGDSVLEMRWAGKSYDYGNSGTASGSAYEARNLVWELYED